MDKEIAEQGSEAVSGRFLNPRIGVFDSTGEFTLVVERALQKLSKFQLSDPHLWVVKLVQAAVLMKSRSLHFSFKSGVVEARVVGGEPPSLEKVREALQAARLPSEPVQGHLFSAILAILGFRPRVLAVVDLSGRGFQFGNGQFEEVQVEEIQSEEIQSEGVQTEEGSREEVLVVSFQRPGSRWGKKETRHLLERAPLCPIPITINGKALRRRLSGPEKSECLAVAILRDGTPVRPLPEVREPHDRWRKSKPQAAPVMGENDTAVVALFQGGRASSQWCWSKDGVLLEPRSLELGDGHFSLWAVLRGDHLKVDLSGFGVIREPEPSEVLGAGVRCISEMVKDNRTELRSALRRPLIRRDEMAEVSDFLQAQWSQTPIALKVPNLAMGLALILGGFAFRAFVDATSDGWRDESLSSLERGITNLAASLSQSGPPPGGVARQTVASTCSSATPG